MRKKPFVSALINDHYESTWAMSSRLHDFDYISSVQNVPILNQNKQNFKRRKILDSWKFIEIWKVFRVFSLIQIFQWKIEHNHLLIDRIDLDLNILTVWNLCIYHQLIEELKNRKNNLKPINQMKMVIWHAGKTMSFW